jgi:hypothetical protein
MDSNPTSVWDIDRNDVDACVRYRDAKGAVTTDEMAVMIKLQDDPTALVEIMREWSPVGVDEDDG